MRRIVRLPVLGAVLAAVAACAQESPAARAAPAAPADSVAASAAVEQRLDGSGPPPAAEAARVDLHAPVREDRLTGADDPRLVDLLTALAVGRRAATCPLTESELRASPVLHDDLAPWCWEPPFLLVAALAPSEAHLWRRRQHTLRLEADLLRAVRERVDELVTAPLGLTPSWDQAGVLPVICDADWNEGAAAIAGTDGPSVLVFDSSARLVGGSFEAADGRVQRVAECRFARDAAQRLFASLRQRKGVAPPRVRSWFETGFAEFVGGVDWEEAELEPTPGSIVHGRVRLDLVATARASRKWGVPSWSIGALAEATTGADRSGLAATLWVVDSWALVHFLWCYDDGVYRHAFTELVRGALAGEAADAAHLYAALGATDDASRDRVVLEFAWYRNQLLRRASGRLPGPGPWRHPSTAPPTGRHDPAAEIPDYDAE